MGRYFLQPRQVCKEDNAVDPGGLGGLAGKLLLPHPGPIIICEDGASPRIVVQRPMIVITSDNILNTRKNRRQSEVQKYSGGQGVKGRAVGWLGVGKQKPGPLVEAHLYPSLP